MERRTFIECLITVLFAAAQVRPRRRMITEQWVHANGARASHTVYVPLLPWAREMRAGLRAEGYTRVCRRYHEAP